LRACIQRDVGLFCLARPTRVAEDRIEIDGWSAVVPLHQCAAVLLSSSSIYLYVCKLGIVPGLVQFGAVCRMDDLTVICCLGWAVPSVRRGHLSNVAVMRVNVQPARVRVRACVYVRRSGSLPPCTQSALSVTSVVARLLVSE
jgi:hypothetical protein